MSLLKQKSAQLRHWLHEQALPLWLENGYLGKGSGFSEVLTLTGKPTSANKRSRVHPRQIYCFSEANFRGLSLSAQNDLVLDGLSYFERTYRLATGFYGALANADDVLIDDSFDLYNQAFALLAFSYVAKAIPETTAEMSLKALSLLEALKLHYAHPRAGFNEAIPSRLPLCSNPHMHLFEAALACEEREGFDARIWAELADEIARLCMNHFIDSKSGGLREFFDADWAPYPGEKGRIMEPGHQFEWAWLLARWAERRHDQRALSIAKRLFTIGETYGICANRQVAVMALLDDFSVHDNVARLWPQTEWLKGAVRLAVLSAGDERERYLQSASKAAHALEFFLDVPLKGLWRDKLKPDGTFVEEAAPASSLYHILCAIYEFEDCIALLSEQELQGHRKLKGN